MAEPEKGSRQDICVMSWNHRIQTLEVSQTYTLPYGITCSECRDKDMRKKHQGQWAPAIYLVAMGCENNRTRSDPL